MKKKCIAALFLVLFVSTTFANGGDLPNGGRTCNSATPCLIEKTEAPPIETAEEKTIFYIFKRVFNLFM